VGFIRTIVQAPVPAHFIETINRLVTIDWPNRAAGPTIRSVLAESLFQMNP
jgi:hypothetical protein